MTQISEIHGFPRNEVAQRSKEVKKMGFLPYLSLTEGEMRLSLLEEQAKMYAAYSKNPVYTRAASDINNALHNGIHNGVSFVGAWHEPMQQYIAKEIYNCSKLIRPASGDFIAPRTGLERPKGIFSGVHIGDILPHDPSLSDCNKYAINYVANYYKDLPHWKIVAMLAVPALNQKIVKKYNEGKAICKSKREVERLLNEGITLFGHHTVYAFLPPLPNEYPSEVAIKRTLQAAGQNDLSRLAGSSNQNMRLWLETAIMQRNSQQNIGPLGSHETNIYWTGLPAEAINKYLAITGTKGEKVRAGAVNGRMIMELLKEYGQSNIGTDPATAKLVIETLKAIFIALIAAAPAIVSALSNQRADAFAGSRGIGTEAVNPSQPDWKTPIGGGDSSNLLTFGLLAAGAYLLLGDEK